MLGHKEVFALAEQPTGLKIQEKYSVLRMWRAQAIASSRQCWCVLGLESG